METIEEKLKSIGCSSVDYYTQRNGLNGLKFFYRGRLFILPQVKKGVYKHRDVLLKGYADIRGYLYLMEENGLKPIRKTTIVGEAKSFHPKLEHSTYWVDQYAEYLSINYLNHNGEQLKAFYDWWMKQLEYTTTPRENLVKEKATE